MDRRGAGDVAGALQLAGAAIGGAAAWGVALAGFGGGFARQQPAGTLVIALVCAGVAVGAVIVSWRRGGGREAVADSSRWIRRGSIPASVPEARWRPILLRRLALGPRWTQAVVALVWIVVAIAVLARGADGGQRLFWAGVALVAVALLARYLVVTLWWRPRIAALLRDRRPAAAREWQTIP